jgi:predicted nucleic acid-binding protein
VIVVSDNSALSALAEAGLTDLLPRLFGTVVIPEAVYRETLHPRAPGLLREWSKLPPKWLKVVPNPTTLLAETKGLGPGEAAAITLAWENRNASRLILDEKRGRRVAEALGLPKTGVLGIIGEAAGRGWLDFDEAIGRIIKTGFHIHPPLIDLVRSRLNNP